MAVMTTLDIVDVVYNRLKAAGLTMTGSIYKVSRPTNSVKEDIVINSLPVSNTRLQETVVNVNIHPAQFDYTANGLVNKSFDWNRVNTLVKAVKSLAFYYWKDDYHFDVQQDGMIDDDPPFYNIRIAFYNLSNLDNG